MWNLGYWDTSTMISLNLDVGCLNLKIFRATRGILLFPYHVLGASLILTLETCNVHYFFYQESNNQRDQTLSMTCHQYVAKCTSQKQAFSNFSGYPQFPRLDLNVWQRFCEKCQTKNWTLSACPPLSCPASHVCVHLFCTPYRSGIAISICDEPSQTGVIYYSLCQTWLTLSTNSICHCVPIFSTFL